MPHPTSARRPQPPTSGGARTQSAGPAAARSMFSLTRPTSSRKSDEALLPSSRREYISPKESMSKGGAPPILPQGSVRHVGGADGTASEVESDHAAVSQWRSSVLKFEVRLREITGGASAHTAPSIERIETVLDLYDEFTATSPHIARILKMFRLEFCRAIFQPNDAVVGDKYSHQHVAGDRAYFDQVDAVVKEAAILQAELDAVEADSSIESLKKQLNSKQSLIAFYEHEVARLTKEHKKATEEMTRMASDSDAMSKQHHQAFVALDEECSRLTKENRELQLQVFKLGKDSREQAVGQGIYSRLKGTKVDALQELYSQGNEEASLLLVMYQLEALENEMIEEFEADLFKSTVAEMPSWRTKFTKGVQLLLEEYHSTDYRRQQLLAMTKQQSTLTRISAASNQPTEEMEVTHQKEERTAQRKKAATATIAAGAQPSAWSPLTGAPPANTREVDGTAADTSSSSGAAAAPPAAAAAAGDRTAHALAVIDGVEKAKSRKLWASKRFGDMFDRKLGAYTHLWDTASPLFHQNLVAPLLDVSSSKFMTGIELYASTPSDSSLLRTVNYIDPTSGIDLPARTVQVKLKYINPLIKPSVTSLSDDGAADEEVRARELPSHEKWLPNAGDPDDKPAATSSTPQSKPQTIVVGADGPKQPRLAPHWTAYRRRYGDYQPLLPRVFDINHVDQLMLQVFLQHHVRLMRRFDTCHETAVARSTGAQMARSLAERLFKDDYNSLDLQNTLFDVLETRYVFPEVAMKVAFELLQSLESHAKAHPYTTTYLECIALITPPSVGFLLSLSLHLLATFWPLSTSQAGESITERDLASVLKGMYPSETLLKINIEELVNDIIISCRKVVTLNGVREHLAASILGHREPILLKLHEMFMFRAGVVHWSELDFADFWETLKQVLPEEHHLQATVKHIYACCVTRKPTRLPPMVLSHIAADIMWSGVARGKANGI